jgi:hypothetical protein
MACLRPRSLFAIVAAGTLLSGCSSLVQPVQAWEKGNLAKEQMVFDSDGLDRLYVEHTYSSKEATSGGAGVGGGGCGCN